MVRWHLSWLGAASVQDETYLDRGSLLANDKGPVGVLKHASRNKEIEVRSSTAERKF